MRHSPPGGTCLRLHRACCFCFSSLALSSRHFLTTRQLYRIIRLGNGTTAATTRSHPTSTCPKSRATISPSFKSMSRVTFGERTAGPIPLSSSANSTGAARASKPAPGTPPANPPSAPPITTSRASSTWLTKLESKSTPASAAGRSRSHFRPWRPTRQPGGNSLPIASS